MLAFDKICAVVAAPDVRSMRRQLRNALRYTRTAELRLDWLSSDAEIARFLDWLASEKPRATLIATCRRREAGGQYAGNHRPGIVTTGGSHSRRMPVVRPGNRILLEMPQRAHRRNAGRGAADRLRAFLPRHAAESSAVSRQARRRQCRRYQDCGPMRFTAPPP